MRLYICLRDVKYTVFGKIIINLSYIYFVLLWKANWQRQNFLSSTINHPVYDFCIIYGCIMFYILQKCALIIDVILKRGRFLSTSVSRNIHYVSITNELDVNRFKRNPGIYRSIQCKLRPNNSLKILKSISNKPIGQSQLPRLVSPLKYYVFPQK